MSATFNAEDHLVMDDLVTKESHVVRIDDGATSFILAGAVLFASLVIGSAVSLFLAGSDATTAAIMRGFISLGLSALAAFLAAAAVTIGVAVLRRSRDAA